MVQRKADGTFGLWDWLRSPRHAVLAIAGVGSLLALALALLGSDSPAAPGGKGPPRVALELPLAKARVEPRGKRPDLLTGKPVGRGEIDWLRPDRRRDVAPAMDVATVWEAVSRPRGETVSIGHGKTAVLGSALVEHGRFQARLKRGPRSVPKRLVFDEVLTSREERVIDGCILAPFQECEKRALSFRDLLAADLRGADLSKTALIRSLASGAALAGSDLRGTDLRGATLLDANLKGAALRGANLADASLHFARVKGKQLRGAYLCNTQLPSGKRSDRDCGAPAPDGPPGAGTDGTNPVVAAEAPSPSAPRPFDDGHDAGPQGQGDARPLPRTPSIDDPHAITAAPKANCKLPPSQDTDKDRLKDCAELAGYTLNVVSPTEVGGTPKAVKVDSDPKDPDTDNDGIDDGVERDRNGNPREQDTDDDGLTDDREANDYRSKLNDADSDNDSQKDPDLFDGSEVKDFRTSPKDADTDGDGSTDFTELKSDSTNARVSQLPQISLDRAPGVEQVKVSVPYTSTTGSTKIERTAEAKQTANTDTHSVTTNDTFAFDLSEQVKGSLNPFKLAGIKVSAKQSYEHNWAINDTHTGTTTQSYSTYEKDSTTTTVAVQPSGCVEAQVVFHNTSRVAYKLGQIQVRALTPDPRDPSQLKLLSALQPVAGNPVGNCPGTSSGTTIELGPGDRQTVALAGIADSHSDLLPYLANPTAIEFEMGSYTLTGTAANGQTIDYLGKTAQDVNNRTAAVTVDFGDDNPLSYRVAAATEFDDRARPLGVRIDDALSEALDGASGGLAPKYDAKGFLGSLRAPGGTVVTNASDPNLGRWFSISNADGFGDAGEKFASTRLKPGDVLAVSFAKDTDDDDLIDVSEDYFGTSRTQPDTDSDGLSDSLEANVGWTVPLPRGQDSSYKVFSSPTSCDADRDGSPDGPGPGNAAFGACPKGPPESSRASSAGPKRMFGTDPSLVDTNRDGIFDATQPYPDVLRNTPPGGRVPQFLRQWGGAGNGNGRFGSNGGLAVNPAGDQIFVADNGNLADSNRSQSIQKFTGSPLDGVPQYASTVPLFSCGRNGLIFDLAWSPERMGPQPSDGNVLWASRSLSPACEHKVVFDRINSATGARTAGGTYSNGVPANPLVAGPNPSWMGAFISVPDASGNIWVSKAGDVPWDTRQCLNYDELHNPDYLPTEYRPATSETVENLRAIGSVGTKPRDTYCRIDPHYSPAYMEKTPRNVEIRPADLQNPAGIGFGKNGEMYVADRFPWGRSGVVRLASGTGEQTANFFTGYQNANPDSRLLWPAGLTVDRQNGYVYVVDQGNASNFNNITDLMADDPGRKIYKFSESLTPLATFGAPGGGEGTFGNPIDIEADGRGDLYVSDEGNKVVQFFHYPYGP